MLAPYAGFNLRGSGLHVIEGLSQVAFDDTKSRSHMDWIKGTLLLVCLLVGCMDFLTTNVILSHGLGELNPIMRLAQEWFGAFWFIPKLGLTFAVMWLLSKSKSHKSIALVVALVSTAVVNNIVIIAAL